MAIFQFLKGETVTVHREEMVGRDSHNNPIYEQVDEVVENVLIAPGPRTDIEESHRPSGTKVAYNLHFPRGYPTTLRGAQVSVRGDEPLAVIGDPRHFNEHNTPGPWTMPVEVERTDG